MELVEYDLDDSGRMTIQGETGRFYRYIDVTAQAEALYDFVKLTIEEELIEELDFRASYDKTRQATQKTVDMPDRWIYLFIQLCLQNNGTISAGKRESHFSSLTDNELMRLEDAVREGYRRDTEKPLSWNAEYYSETITGSRSWLGYQATNGGNNYPEAGFDGNN